MPEVDLLHVPPSRLRQCWPAVERALRWKVARLTEPVGVLHARLMAGTSELWVAMHPRFPNQLSSVIVTTIVANFHEPKTLKVELLSGRHARTWMDSTACTLSRFAVLNGCTRLAITGRIGWRQFRERFTLPVIWTRDQESRSADHDHQYHTEH